ncbi:MAG: hypothetical protein JNK85_15455 [Verrucomicrobiales bacterium]|nr:hypothetical protein [Verrucomicrobiales bacterium]
MTTAGHLAPRHSRLPPRAQSLLFALIALVAEPRLPAEPYTPRSDDEVLERLPAGFRRSEARLDQENLANDPDNLRESIALAQSYLETARSEGDGRYLGFAQAVLAPWWDRPSPPYEVLFLRARVRASLWAFDQAGRDLDTVIAQHPEFTAARNLRFEIALARGEGDIAQRLVDAWPSAAVGSAPGVLVRARWASWRGEAAVAWTAVSTWLETLGADRTQDRHAALGLLADLALQAGQPGEARRHFEAQRRLAVRDVAATVAYADLLLDLGEPSAVIEIANDSASAAAAAVRLVAALDLLIRSDPSPTLRERRRTLADEARRQLEAQERRGDPSGLPERVFYQLKIENRPAEAAREARDLWALRRKSDDVRWVLEAGVGAQDSSLTGQVTEWIRSHRLTDARWAGLLKKAEAMR